MQPMQYYAYYWEIWFSVSVGRSVSTKNLLDYEVQTMSDSELIQRMHPYVIQSLDSRYFDHFRATRLPEHYTRHLDTHLSLNGCISWDVMSMSLWASL